MPIYEYVCRKCRKTFEYMQRMSDSPKRKCEACGAQALERLISQTSFQLKGSGWYKDLYSSPKPATGDTKGGGEAKSGGSEGGSSPAAGASSDSGSSAGASSGSGSSSGSNSGSGGSSETTKPGKKAKKGSR